MSFVYNTIILLYLVAIHLYGLFNRKARSWVFGRRAQSGLLASLNPEGRPLIWFHCASLGEFEQGRPVIENLRRDHPDHFILLTFFSPSGYEIRKDYKLVDQVAYLPMDLPGKARAFLRQVQPMLAVFVKYEFWFNYIREMAERNIPVVVISANFRKSQHFFKWYGTWSRSRLKLIDRIFVQRESSIELLKSIGYERAVVGGDTRFDRVATIASRHDDLEDIELFKADQSILLAGSTWPEDEEVVLKAFDSHRERMKLIIVPHEVGSARIRQLTDKIRDPYSLYSEKDKPGLKETRIMVIDSIGLLSRLYRYGEIAYIGGGFGAGIHNILEAAAFSRPVIFGPNYSKFNEARELLSLGGAFSIKDEEQLFKLVVRLNEEKALYEQAASTAGTYVSDNKGATTVIVDYMNELIRKLGKP